MSITVFQPAHNFIVSYDAEIYFFVLNKVRCEAVNNFGMISEKQR